MRKANKENVMGEVVIEDGALEASIPLLDVKAKKRSSVEQVIASIRNDIEYREIGIREYQETIGVLKIGLDSAVEKLDKMPVSEMTVEDVKKQMELIGKLPWIQRARLHPNGELMLTSRADSLQTTFYTRVVYKGGNRVQELLPKPITLPMPQYNFCIKLKNMGGNWGRNGHLNMRLADPNSLKFMPSPLEVGLAQAAYAHWSTSSPPWSLRKDGEAHEATWSDLCLRDYENVLKASGKINLIELLNSIAMFLQNAGWAHAYRTKMDWAITLGYQPYVTNLMRPLLDSESFEAIQNDTRSRLSIFLEENGITQHMFNYGALAEGEIEDPFIGRFEQLYREIERINPEQVIGRPARIITGLSTMAVGELTQMTEVNDDDDDLDDDSDPL